MREILIPDVVRLLLLIAFALMLGATGIIIALYYRVARRRGPSGRGLLPRHVWTIGVSYLVFAGLSIERTVGFVGKPFGSPTRVAITGGAYLLGLYALALMLRRIGHGRTRARIGAEDDREEGLT